MKQLIPVLALAVVLPSVAHAQLDIILGGSRPVVRANVGGLIISAGVGLGGIDLSVGDGRTTVSTSRAPRRGTGTSSSGRTAGSTRTAGTARTTGSARRSGAARATAAGVLATADDYVGTKYVWGGETPRGFDCSGFVQYVYRQHGVELPRTSRQQARVGESVPRTLGALEPGDLMLFASSGSRIDHIAIYAGDGQIIHSSSSGGGVGYDSFTTKRGRWFVSHHVATRRVLADGRSLVGALSAALRAFAEYDPPDHAPKR